MVRCRVLRKKLLIAWTKPHKPFVPPKRRTKTRNFSVSLVTFNDNVKTVDCVPAKEIQEVTAETYRLDCWTALYDTMRMSFNAPRSKVAEDDWVRVIVVTDGCKNSSRGYSGKAIKALMWKEKAGCFAYVVAN